MDKLLQAYVEEEENEYKEEEKQAEKINTESYYSINKNELVKVRNVPHVVGNFSVLLFFTITFSKKIRNFVEIVKKVLLQSNSSILFDEVEKVANDDLHISLTKNLFIKYHHIENFKSKVKDLANKTSCFKTLLSNKIKYFSNEFKSRNFIAIEIIKNKNMLNLIEKINTTLQNFGLEEFDSKVFKIIFKVGFPSSCFHSME